ncbi:MAG: DUF1563 domain-containing protein [Flavobacterium sp.]|nr:DUF1563 domain-containing protein [Flavobacterium sp.]
MSMSYFSSSLKQTFLDKVQANMVVE